LVHTPTPGLQVLYVALWWLMLEGAGLLALPLSFRLFRHLPDRGYALSKPLGLVLVGYIVWMLSTLGLLRNTWGSILLSAVLATALSLFFYLRGRKQGRVGAGILSPLPAHTDLWQWIGSHRRTVIASELVFALAFALWVGYKAFDPNIAITEKPMEFAFLNAITRSERFPPYDPWMSGYSISYYYFGYVLVATLAKFAGTPTSVAFNLGIAMLFALTASGAFSVVHNLVYVAARRRARHIRHVVGRAIYYGILAAVMIPLMGNLEGALEFAHANGLGVTVDEPGNVTGPFWEWIDVKNLTESGSISDTWYPTDGWWWWRASRLIHDKGLTGNDMEVIDEFPAFSFLLGDMHPHVLAFPFVFMVIGLAFNVLLSGTRDPTALPVVARPGDRAEQAGSGDRAEHEAEASPSAGLTTGEWWLVYLCLGAIGFLNTWDMPFYFFLLVAAYALNRYLCEETRSAPETLIERALGGRSQVGWGAIRSPWLRKTIYRAVELALASVVLYLPYWIYSRPQAGAGILPNLFNVSRLAHLFLMFGAFFVALVALLVVLFVDLGRSGRSSGRVLLRQGSLIWLGTMLFFPALMAIVLIPVLVSPSVRTYIDDVLANPQVQQFLGPQTLGSLLRISLRIRSGLLPPQLQAIRMPAGPWTFLFISLLVAAILFWYVRTTLKPVTTEARPGDRARHEERALDVVSPSLRFVLLLAFVGLMLVFSVEFVYLRDAFGTRMNTVFKFYFQAWALLGVVAAFGVYYVVDHRSEDAFRSADAFRSVAVDEARSGGGAGRFAFGSLFAVLVIAGLLYPLAASLSRTGGFAGPATLDGLAFVARERPEEYAVVRWLNENVAGHPVIVEAVRGSFAYEYARVSSRTGLPAVMGWTGHEGQWHGLYDEIGRREQDVNLLYGGSVQDARRLLDQYDVTYVVVGYLERADFPNAAAKFERFMDVAFREGDTIIFKVRGK
jgi:YYY domain-containing protein